MLHSHSHISYRGRLPESQSVWDLKHVCHETTLLPFTVKICRDVSPLLSGVRCKSVIILSYSVLSALLKLIRQSQSSCQKSTWRRGPLLSSVARLEPRILPLPCLLPSDPSPTTRVRMILCAAHHLAPPKMTWYCLNHSSPPNISGGPSKSCMPRPSPLSIAHKGVSYAICYRFFYLLCDNMHHTLFSCLLYRFFTHV